VANVAAAAKINNQPGNNIIFNNRLAISAIRSYGENEISISAEKANGVLAWRGQWRGVAK
jgi:hypothetical protein